MKHPNFAIKKSYRCPLGHSKLFIPACIGVIVFVALVFSVLIRPNTGDQVLDNATKNGAIKVADAMSAVKVKASEQFSDIADQDGNISLANINLVYAKVLLAASNAQDAYQKGVSLATASHNLDKLISECNALCQKLKEQMCSKDLMEESFLAVSKGNAAPGFGSIVELGETPDSWTCARLPLDGNSNVQIKLEQIPRSVELSSFGLKKSRGRHLLPAGQSIKMLDRNFSLIPFCPESKSQLISEKDFKTASKTASDLVLLPNAWSVAGLERQGGQAPSLKTAFAVAPGKPIVPFHMGGYIRISIKPAACMFRLNDRLVSMGTVRVGTEPKQIWSPVIPIGKDCKVIIRALVGVESLPGDLLSTLFPFDRGLEKAMPVLMQRICQMSPNTSELEIKTLLRSIDSSSATDQRYYIYVDRDGRMRCDASPQNCLHFYNLQAKLENRPYQLVKQVFPSGLGDGADIFIQDLTNRTESQVISQLRGEAETNIADSKLLWSPASGYDGFLGELSLQRTYIIDGQAF